MATRDDDRPPWDPYDPLKRELPSETLGSRQGTVQGLRYGRATRGMGYGPQTNSESFGAYGHPRAFEPSHQSPQGVEGGGPGNDVRYGSNRQVQSSGSDYGGLASASIPATLGPLEDMMFEQRYAASSGPPRRRHYPRGDTRVRDDIAERLYRSHIDASSVSIAVSEGVVTLEGEVDSRRTKHDIEDLAAATPGVRDVENRVRVASAGEAERGDALQGSDGRAVSGRRSAALEPPAGGLDTPQHEEWLLDEGVAESFPASDTPSSVQPGSIASQKS